MTAQQITVLVVEDNPVDARLVRDALLEGKGAFRVDRVDRLSAGLARLERGGIDVVLLDLGLPDSQGLATYTEVQRRMPDLAIVVMSGLDDEAFAVQAVQAGAQDYLIKGRLDGYLLVRALRYALERAQLLSRERLRARQLQALTEASLTINATLSLEALLQMLTEKARTVVGAHLACTSLVRDGNWAQTTNVVSLSDKYAAWRSNEEQPDGSGICSLIHRENRPIRMTQAELEAHPVWQDFQKAAGGYPQLRGWLAAPLIGRDGRNIGMVQLSDKDQGEFTEDDEAILVQLAQVASVAIENVRLYQEVREAIRVRDEVLAYVSHDLHNPLTTIKGHAQLLARQIMRHELQEASRWVQELRTIDATATRMTMLIGELIDVARLEIGQPLELNRQPTDLVALVRKCTQELQKVAERHLVRVEARTDVVGMWDPVRLERVLVNLLDNATKYSPEGAEVAVVVERRSDEHGNWAMLEVRDQGIGIPAADLPHIFERFYRAKNVVGRLRGVGIGLAGARAIVVQHGGMITAASEEGKGSTFRIQLPLEDVGFSTA